MVIVVIAASCFIWFETAVNKADVKTGKWNDFSFVKIEKAKRENIPVLLYFGADWCEYCTVFEKTVLKNPETKELLDNYFLIKVDRSNTKDIKTKIIKRIYRARYFPTVIMLYSNDYQKIIPSNKGAGYFNTFLEQEEE